MWAVFANVVMVIVDFSLLTSEFDKIDSLIRRVFIY